jgi:beta-glucosidase
MNKRLFLLFIAIYPLLLFAQVSPEVKVLASKLSTDEKVRLVIGMGFKFPGIPNAAEPKQDTNGNYIKLTPFNCIPGDSYVIEKVNGAAGRTHAIEKLGIPSMVLSDGPAGVRIEPKRDNHPGKTFYATAWPVGTLLASTWDTTLVRKVGVAFGNEVKEYGIDILLGPGMNIHRNPLGGRNFEYYSEDPVVSGNIAAALVKGVQSNGVGACIKHFVANNIEFNRMKLNEKISERALREIYLRGFEIAVKKAQPWAIMTSYNLIDGTYTSENKTLLNGTVREDWGFKGLIMTDWWGGNDAVAQQNAGNDLLMPGDMIQYLAIKEALKNGTLTEAQLTENVEHILAVMMNSPSYKGYKYSEQPDLTAHSQVSRKAATEGMVLLKNNSGLPLTKKNIALFGNTSYAFIAGGTGSGDVNKAYTVSLLDGLKNGGYIVNNELKQKYEAYIADGKTKQPKPVGIFGVVPPIPEYEVDGSYAESLAKSNDVAIITLGRNAGEGNDRKVENDFNLSDREQALIKTITAAFHAQHKKVVVVLNIGGVIETASWKDEPDAILLAWQPGIEGGNAVTDVLSGKVNPSGKLATTFPVNYSDVPSANDFPGKRIESNGSDNELFGVPSEATYSEGIYIGYRYYNTFDVKPSYEFGYGLSYSNFSYSNFKLSASSFTGKLTATVTITNIGKTAGKEVAELYISAPGKSMDKPVEELKGFTKTRLLKAGESETVSFTIRPSDLASFDTNSLSWIAEAGKYTAKVGASSLKIKASSTFNVAKELVVEKVSTAIVPSADVNDLKTNIR